MSNELGAHLESFVETPSVDPEMLSEFEKSLLAYTMTNLSFASQVTKFLTPEEFSNPDHRKVFAVIQEVLDGATTKNYGIVTFSLVFQEKNIPIDINVFYPYLGAITDDSEANQIAAKLHDIHLKKELKAKLSSLIIGLEGLSSLEAIEKLKQLEAQIGSKLLSATEVYGMQQIVDSFEEFLTSTEKPKIYKLGISAIDRTLIDFAKKNLTVIGARPATGKTALMVRSAYTNALNKVPVHIFSLEMSKQQLSARFFSIPSRIPPRMLLSKQHNFTPDVLNKYKEHLASLPLRITIPPSIHIASLIAEMRESVVKYGTEIFYIDYLQLIRAQVGSGRYDVVSFISQELTAVAKELNVSVVALSQLRRPQSKAFLTEPTMEELKESGDIEQDASLIILMYKPKDAIGNISNDHIEIRMKVEKQRNGPAGNVYKVALDPAKMNFYEIMEDEAVPDEYKKGK